MPDNGRLLLFSSAPKADENLIGYLLRLTELNKLETLSWMLQKAQIKSYVRSNFSFAFNPFINLLPLSQLTGVNESTIAKLFYAPIDQARSMGDYLIFDSTVPQYMIRVRQPKVCPSCLREANYARKIWDLAPTTTCPIHKCLLLDECPNCAGRISWKRYRVSRCKCDLDWRDCETQTVGDPELKVSHQIHLLCKLQPAAALIECKTKINPLYNINLKNFLSALFFIASQYAGGIDTKGKHLAPSIRNAELHVILCRAWNVFESWPDKYFEFLNWRRSQITNSPSIRGLRRDFAEYKSALYRQLATPELNFISHAFEEYLTSHWDGGYTTHVKRLNGATPHSSKYVSRREAKELLRVGVISIDKLIAVGKLKAVVKRQDRTRLILIERGSLLTLKHELDQSLYLKQVQRLLGLSHKRVLELVACGLLNPLRGPTVDECSDWKFSEREVKELLHRLKGMVRSNELIRDSDAVSFLMTFRKLRSAKILMGQFIKDIFAGEIYPLGVNAKQGLNAFQFSKKQLAEYANKSSPG
jgi:hypothetical protein